MKVERNMPSAAYHAEAGASASRLKALRRSPAHLRAMDDEPIKGSALIVGGAFHAAVLEPELFKEEYFQAPDVDRRTREGKEIYQTLMDANIGRQILSVDEWNSVTGMAQAIRSHGFARDLIDGRSETEISLFWEDCGIPCKARLDAYSADQRCIIDIKSTADASRDEFARSIAKFGYHIQAAWYISAMRKAGFAVDSMIFVAVEKANPYGVAVYTLDDDTVAEGERLVSQLLPIMSNCMKTNNWHGYDPTVQTIGIPRWAFRGEEASL